MRRRASLIVALTALAAFIPDLASPTFAWSPETRLALAQQAGRMAPPDLARLFARHEESLRRGVSRGTSDSSRGAGDKSATVALAACIEAIRRHLPFAEVVQRLGGLAVLVAESSDPLTVSLDPTLARVADDFHAYVDSARPRFSAVFYGLDRDFDARGDIGRLLAAARQRSAPLASAIGREYERVEFEPGRGAFDDRSTAFAVGALAYSYGLSDLARVYRHVWLAAGGGDPRRLPFVGSGPLLSLRPDPPAVAGIR